VNDNVRPLHVAHVISTLQTGGAEKMLANYLMASNRTRYRHTLLCLRDMGEFVPEVAASGVDTRRMPVKSRAMGPSLWRFRRWLIDNQVDVVHTHMFFPAMWGRMAAILAGVPAIITTEHGKELWKKPWHVTIDRVLARFTDRHIAVSQDGLDIRLHRENIRPDKITLLPNGVPIPPRSSHDDSSRNIREEFGITDNLPLVGTVGRVVEAKGYPLLVEALHSAAAAGQPFRWLQIGDGPQLEEIKSLTVRHGVDQFVTHAGRRTDIPSLLSGLDIYVMCSVREGLPVALLEAMAAGCRIVVTDVGGMPDTIEHERHGLVVPSENPEALRAGIERLLANPTIASDMGEAAYQRVLAEFSIESIAARIESIYDECLLAKGISKGSWRE
jgi:glycosyltransferase involved in cell wall biosynthesis